MKIAHKLIALIALAAIAIVLLTAVNYSKFQDAKEHSATVSDDALPSVVLISEINLAFANARRELLNHIIQGEAAKKKEAEGRLNAFLAQLEEKLKAYDHYVSSPEGQQNISELRKELAQWATLSKLVITASEMSDTEAAEALVRNQTAPQAAKVATQLEIATKRNEAASNEAKKNIANSISSAISLSIGMGVMLMIAIAIIGMLIARSIINPLNSMRQFVLQLGSDYDFTRRITVSSRDEIGESLEALNGLIATLQGSLQQLNRIGRDVTGSATGLSNASSELSDASQSVSNAASSMAAGVEEVTVSISHVADRADECDRTAREAGQMASTGGAVIESTITSINQIADDVRVSAQQIESLKERTASINAVVNVIKDIADQTNLLALNAAIEAARAGDLGRGFAVVADEVRKLAERTASSTQEIIGTVSAIQNEANATVTTMQQTVRQVDLGVERAQEASDAISKIRHNADQVVEQVSEITGSMREQSAASAMMAQQVEQVAQMSEESSSVAQNTASEGERLRQLSKELDSAISRYRV
ncbi:MULTISPECIES: methyl-accepting chemotaxis protein [Deefgea]|uniref:HAMP domain-containing protein n=1 Tax=Deefgea chitinilytica TaxID=570276 RepID=A0ABS2CF86_9NEIS|nr:MULTISPECIES: HAMP domain-containing methyl-accepting chemotaxis protein [Deefgea]MBM5572677.1 HAMP domain-containing protein [Deefgea chitinilytica]MBM9889913.1 methyl-accepting chemotaxis protein [Deefgea sp. CFH1-16]